MLEFTAKPGSAGVSRGQPIHAPAMDLPPPSDYFHVPLFRLNIEIISPLPLNLLKSTIETQINKALYSVVGLYCLVACVRAYSAARHTFCTSPSPIAFCRQPSTTSTFELSSQRCSAFSCSRVCFQTPSIQRMRRPL